jgi:predicted nucleotidyltransferase
MTDTRVPLSHRRPETTEPAAPVHDPLPERATDRVHGYLRHAILRVEVGSTVYGTGRPGHEDHDQMCVFVLPPDRVLGMADDDGKDWRTAAQGVRSTPDDIDLALYSVRKYVRLAAHGNPSILVALFTPPAKTFTETTAGAVLRAHHDLFHTREAGRRFLGYMNRQFQRMADSRAGIRAPRSNRPELVAEYGYDTKFAMHAVRLGFQGLEFLETGRMVLPIPGDVGDTLRAVRSGTYGDYDDIAALGDYLRTRLVHAIDTADVPDRADTAKVNDLLWRLHRIHWTQEGLL